MPITFTTAPPPARNHQAYGFDAHHLSNSRIQTDQVSAASVAQLALVTVAPRRSSIRMPQQCERLYPLTVALPMSMRRSLEVSTVGWSSVPPLDLALRALTRRQLQADAGKSGKL